VKSADSSRDFLVKSKKTRLAGGLEAEYDSNQGISCQKRIKSKKCVYNFHKSKYFRGDICAVIKKR
jgi:hypothetical protein